MSKRDLSPDSLEAQADALLAAADSMDMPSSAGLCPNATTMPSARLSPVFANCFIPTE